MSTMLVFFGKALYGTLVAVLLAERNGDDSVSNYKPGLNTVIRRVTVNIFFQLSSSKAVISNNTLIVEVQF